MTETRICTVSSLRFASDASGTQAYSCSLPLTPVHCCEKAHFEWRLFFEDSTRVVTMTQCRGLFSGNGASACLRGARNQRTVQKSRRARSLSLGATRTAFPSSPKISIHPFACAALEAIAAIQSKSEFDSGWTGARRSASIVFCFRSSAFVDA